MAKAKPKTIDEVYLNAEEPKSPAMMQYLQDVAKEAAAEMADEETESEESESD